MFISDRFAFLELHKTGCTHIRNILRDYYEGELVGAHNQADPEMFTGKRMFLGSIRDPWEWYLSLWAYGYNKKGGVFNQTYQSKNSRIWQDTYDNVNDAVAFKKWLHMMNDANFLADIGEGYFDCQVSQIAGLLTFRYLTLFCTKLGSQGELDRLSTLEKIKSYERNNCFIDHFVRNETLEADLILGLEACAAKKSSDTKSDIMSRPRSNTSYRKAGLDYYYDIESEKLVIQRERLIVEKFLYIAPGKRAISL